MLTHKGYNICIYCVLILIHDDDMASDTGGPAPDGRAAQHLPAQ